MLPGGKTFERDISPFLFDVRAQVSRGTFDRSHAQRQGHVRQGNVCAIAAREPVISRRMRDGRIIPQGILRAVI